MNNIEPFISSTARVLLSDFTTLAEIIRARTQTIHEQTQELDIENIPLLSTQQIVDALQGPFHLFFQTSIKAYMTLAHIRVDLNLYEDEKLHPQLEKESKTRLSKEQLKKVDPSELAQIEKQLNALIQTQNEQWQEQIKLWQETLINSFQDIQFSLSEIEQQELLELEPRSELEKRFTDLSISLPKLKERQMHFDDYYRMKTYLACHSSLSRRHLSYEDSEIQVYLKGFKKIFESFRQQENQLAKNQQHEIEATTKKIAFTNP